MGTVYQFDTFSQTFYMTGSGAWNTGDSGYYYAIIPLEVGKAYKVTLQNVTTLQRFRVAQADSTEIGTATLSSVGFTDTPANGYTLEFKAIKDYLICYGGVANGGEVELTQSDSLMVDLTGTKWLFNNSVTRGSTSGVFAVECIIKSGEHTITIPYEVGSYTYDRIFIGGPTNRNQHVFAAGVYGAGSQANGYFISYCNEGDGYYSSGWQEFTNSGWRYYTSGYSPAVRLDDNTPIIDAPTIEFTGGADATNAGLIAWLKANATLVEEEPTATVITYNNETIATLEAGQTATIKTANTEVEHDIVITPVFPIEIAYGDIIATANEGQTATIKCANTEMEHDIVVSAKASITDLTGTTWNIPYGWSATAAYGSFKVSGLINDGSFTGIMIGYDGTSKGNPIENQIRFTNNGVLKVVYDDRFNLSLTINNGDDVTNADLIAWLETYGLLQDG